MNSTLPYFDLDFYTEKNTTIENSDLFSLWKKACEDAIYEVFIESKAFNKKVEKTEKLFKKNPSKLALLDL